jgi:hypothetical protein
MTPTQVQVEKAIKNYLKKNGKDKHCSGCMGFNTKAPLCPAHETELTLANWLIKGERLTEQYFELIKE